MNKVNNIIITFLFLCKATISLSMQINPPHVYKIGPMQGEILSTKRQQIQTKTAYKIHKQWLGCQAYTKQKNIFKKTDKKLRDIILVSTQKNWTYIFDIKSCQKIHSTIGDEKNKKTRTKTYPLKIKVKNNSIYLYTLLKSKFYHNYTLNSHYKIDLLNKNKYEEIIGKNDTNNKNSHRKTSIKKENTISTYTDPKLGSRYTLIESQEYKKNNILELYNNQTRKIVYKSLKLYKNKEKIASIPICFNKLDHRINAKNKKLKHALFNKNNNYNFIILLFNKYVSIFDINKMKFVFKKEFKHNTNSIFLSTDEKTFGVSVGKYIYIFKNPIAKELEFRNKMLNNKKLSDITIKALI